MKDGFRQSMAWLHTWSGLVVGWVLFFVFVTGTAGYFDNEIDRWMRPELPLPERVGAIDRDGMLARSLARLAQVAPNAKEWRITLPHQSMAPREPLGLSIDWEDLPERGRGLGLRGGEQLAPHSGALRAEVEPRATGGGWQLYVMHYRLHYLDYTTAIRLVGICTMLMLLAIFTGVITHKKIFKDFFTFRPGKGQRSWLDAHNISSVMALPFFVMITYTGLVFFPMQYLPVAFQQVYQGQTNRFYDELFDSDKLYQAVTAPTTNLDALVAHGERLWGEGMVAGISLRHEQGQPLSVDVRRVRGGQVDFYDPQVLRYHAHSGEALEIEEIAKPALKARSVLIALHLGLFADAWLRWLYFLSGLLGCAMIATGLVLWTVKRRNRHLKRGEESSRFDAFGLRLVEVLNVGTIAGLPFAVVMYFWANRLLPLNMAARAEWEVHCLFIAWGWVFLYATLRPLKKAWVESLWMAAAACVLIPPLNLLTSDRHLGVSIPHGDWALAGVDLSMLAFAALFAGLALKLKRKWQYSEQPGGQGAAVGGATRQRQSEASAS
ncbi:PepSY-associated TM helix domain-containing protein [Stutzerimonas kirkiae]|uniref:Peptidase n=1 Tax=Stutzerimonas kirkiae TaxID=2211392 RepID=A0A4Q9R7M0_9GAMM|nr:PepSY-associated TM helix domain-containing protein [Stutzerimonas kirkiae]TBU96575.1 peptidase [Stutzerimonas kirkiae]TBV02142.1 peptidase [Stutzerimonas kirkiae]TBV08812.1 peptidase [Stutzerimonas kirkiae]TBV15647.1 peptidase [Stutzerimonas kirkiae]